MTGKFISERSLTIKSSEPDKNFKEEVIKCGRDDEGFYKSYIFFDLSTLPERAQITSAKLYLNLLERTNPTALYAIGIYPLLEDFGDFTVYSFQPKIYVSPINYHLIYKKSGKIELNLTNIVQKWKNGMLINKGLLLKGEGGRFDMLTFGSSYNKIYDNIPCLEIAYSLDSPVPFGQSIVKYNDYEEKLNYINGTVSSSPIDFSHLIQATVFISNLGGYEVTAASQYSPDNITWIQDYSKKILPAQTAYIIPKIYSKYYSLKIQSTGYGTLKIYISYLIYL
ncbi:hypothetical protein SAMN05443428_10377 [Caloramator quimbayensis]|uniref:DUF6385 domain-containing protein n=1 Tax=Caloramator quimbayensis TaxID=1147123 RepID=A0A1T4WQ60_9CLOT|nr:DNRLRE domain-containing protein [Caloramator quimbayensis]SKA79500.1 hypothetical protein SAMN05443428_10377 [Caloramator quimbayensis]